MRRIEGTILVECDRCGHINPETFICTCKTCGYTVCIACAYMDDMKCLVCGKYFLSECDTNNDKLHSKNARLMAQKLQVFYGKI